MHEAWTRICVHFLSICICAASAAHLTEMPALHHNLHHDNNHRHHRHHFHHHHKDFIHQTGLCALGLACLSLPAHNPHAASPLPSISFPSPRSTPNKHIPSQNHQWPHLARAPAGGREGRPSGSCPCPSLQACGPESRAATSRARACSRGCVAGSNVAIRQPACSSRAAAKAAVVLAPHRQLVCTCACATVFVWGHWCESACVCARVHDACCLSVCVRTMSVLGHLRACMQVQVCMCAMGGFVSQARWQVAEQAASSLRRARPVYGQQAHALSRASPVVAHIGHAHAHR